MDTNVRQCKICETNIDILIESRKSENFICDDCIKKIEESGLLLCENLNFEGELEFIGTREQWDKYDKLINNIPEEISKEEQKAKDDTEIYLENRIGSKDYDKNGNFIK